MPSKKILSICIPTRGRGEILLRTLDSILKSDVEPSLYEVVVYDSSDDNALNTEIEKWDFEQLRYVRGENNGYLNLITALKLGEGAYLKLHNDYSLFNEGALALMIKQLQVCIDEKPMLIFTSESVKLNSFEFNTFNELLFNLSFHSTWANIFGVWKDDFERLKNLEKEPMFPHTSILFAITEKSSYRVNNQPLFRNQEVLIKGGYNLFHVFGVIYINMLVELYNSGKITLKTLNHIKSDMLYNFFVPWYSQTKILPNSYTFALSELKKSMRTHYSAAAYLQIQYLAYHMAFKVTVKKLLNSLVKR